MENERLAKLEVEVERNTEDIITLKKNGNLIQRMNALLEVQIEADKKSERKIELLEDVIHSVNDNLTNLNHSQTKLNEKLDIIDERVDKIEDKHATSSKDGYFNVVKFISQDVPKYIGLLIIGAILAYIGLK